MEVRVASALNWLAEAPVTGMKLRAVSAYIKPPKMHRTHTPKSQMGMVLFFSGFFSGGVSGVVSIGLVSMIFHN